MLRNLASGCLESRVLFCTASIVPFEDPCTGAGGPATHSVACVVATLEVEGSELLRPLPLVHRWRTKQNLDYCFLMMYAQSKGIYYVQVSTDSLLRPPFPRYGPGWQALPSLCPS